jgi:hypothetical protein
MKRIIMLSAYHGLLIFLCISCQTTLTNTPSPSATPKILANWWTVWLTNPVCQPPCWQQITPGMTTREEAVSILENNPKVVMTYNSKYGLSWNFGTKTDVGNISVSNDEKVSSIWLGSSSNIDLHLDEVVKVYGFPKFVQPYDCREGMCSTALVYPELGMYLNAYLKNERTGDKTPKLNVMPDTVVTRVYFIEPGLESFSAPSDLFESGQLIDWKGYGTYP